MLDQDRMPRHVAIIMDGNGRWAKNRGLPRLAGHNAGMKAGIVLNPSTSPEAVRYVISSCDMVLLMSVNPGAGGQKFIPETVQKIRQLRAIAKDMGASPDIEIDGGINPDTGKLCAEAGASVLVAGSSVFGAPDPKEMVKRLHDIGR